MFLVFAFCFVLFYFLFCVLFFLSKSMTYSSWLFLKLSLIPRSFVESVEK